MNHVVDQKRSPAAAVHKQRGLMFSSLSRYDAEQSHVFLAGEDSAQPPPNAHGANTGAAREATDTWNRPWMSCQRAWM
jgi:hypothetical protein